MNLLLQGKDVQQLASDGSAFVMTLDTLSKRVVFSGDYIYIGWAEPGTATSAASWRVSRIYINSGTGDATQLWADGDLSFDNIFDDRASLSYS